MCCFRRAMALLAAPRWWTNAKCAAVIPRATGAIRLPIVGTPSTCAATAPAWLTSAGKTAEGHGAGGRFTTTVVCAAAMIRCVAW